MQIRQSNIHTQIKDRPLALWYRENSLKEKVSCHVNENAANAFFMASHLLPSILLILENFQKTLLKEAVADVFRVIALLAKAEKAAENCTGNIRRFLN